MDQVEAEDPASKRVAFNAGTNWALDEMMEARGIESTMQLYSLLRQQGFKPAVADIRGLYNGTMPALNPAGVWNRTPLMIANFFQCLVEDIFDAAHRRLPKTRSTAANDTRPTTTGRVAATENETFDSIDLKRLVALALDRMSPRERRIIRMHFGFDGPNMSFAEIGRKDGVTRTRIRQIANRALDKVDTSHVRRRLKRTFDGEGAGAPHSEDSEPRAQLRGPFQATERVDWPDLRNYGLEMKLVRMSAGSSVAVVRSIRKNEIHPQHERKLLGLGFEKHPNGILFNRSSRYPLKAIIRSFPTAETRSVSIRDVTIVPRREMSVETTAPSLAMKA